MHPNRTPNCVCEQCGKAFWVKPGRIKTARYCSKTCHDASMVKPRGIVQSDIDRFWSKVDKESSPNGCWLWMGAKDYTHGYGGFSIRTSQGIGQIAAHRFSMMLVLGDAIDGLHVCHDCPGGDNPSCVNPDHLFLGTHLDNMRDMVAKGRASKGHGLRGEELYQAILTDNQVMEARQRYVDTDYPLWRMAKEYGITRRGLVLAINGTNWSHLPMPKPTVSKFEESRIRAIREFNGRPVRSKITSEDVVAIRAMFDAGKMTRADLARKYELTYTNIDRIVKREIWKDVA